MSPPLYCGRGVPKGGKGRTLLLFKDVSLRGLKNWQWNVI
jgi:hypothetical protein